MNVITWILFLMWIGTPPSITLQPEGFPFLFLRFYEEKGSIHSKICKLSKSITSNAKKVRLLLLVLLVSCNISLRNSVPQKCSPPVLQKN